jgi:hypothetical protein
MTDKEVYLSNIRRMNRLKQTSRDWIESKRYKKANSKQINRIQTHHGTVRDQLIPKHINPLKTIRRRSSKRGGTRKHHTMCRRHHTHTKSCRR